MDNPFILPNERYTRDMAIISGYQEDAAKYLQLQTGQPLEKCLAYVKAKTQPGGKLGMKDPRALVLTKDQHGDRQKSSTTFLSFLNTVNKNQYTLSPSMAAYMPDWKKQSTHAQYIEEGVKKRKGVKAEMLEAERNGETEKALVKKGEQNNLKINNNSYSGATVSVATILHYKSTHSSLTSTCRTATSYANAANEKFLAGNRHYYTPEITKANLLAIINASDTALITQTCERYGLVYPTVDDTLACIQHSTRHYWGAIQHPDHVDHHQLLRQMIERMTPAERAAVVYVGDLYHLHKHNPNFVVTLLKTLAQQGSATTPVTDDAFYACDDDVQLLANFLCYDEVAGRKHEDLLAEAPEIWEQIKATAAHAIKVLNDYKGIIDAFWLTPVVPSSIHAFPSAYRKAAVVSDTDSTMFTLQYWIEQCFGYVSYKAEAKRVVFGMVFLVSELMLHILAIQSKNMGVSDKRLRLLAMKNEFYFAVLSMTTRSKHYYASQDAQEGVMFAKAKLEVKGVGLRDSKVPKRINDQAKGLMDEIIDTIKQEDFLDMRDILKRIGDIEREINTSIHSGSYELMTSGQVKANDSYKKPEVSNYMHYELWRDVFAPFLGDVPEPPYAVIKVSLACSNRTEINQWCERMNNPALAEKLKAWLHERKRTNLNTLLIPAIVVETTGIPPEIIAGIDSRKVIFNTVGVFYLMLESLGIFLQDKKLTRLVSDYY